MFVYNHVEALAMNWFKRGIYKATLAIATMLLLVVLMVWVPVSAAGAYERAPGLAGLGTGTVQATPTVDATLTVLNKEKLNQEIKQLQQNNDRGLGDWLWSNTTAVLSSFLSTLVVVIGALIGFRQWSVGRRDTQRKEADDRIAAQDKELKDRQNEREKRAEERFQSTVMGLGDAKDGIRISAAILLRTFLRPEHELFYIQIFDIAVANLRLPRIPHTPEDRNTPQSLTTLSQALVVVFKEVFPLARSQNKGSSPSLDAARIQLDNAYLALADLKNVWMPHAYLRRANLKGTDLSQANLSGADLRGAILEGTNLKGTDLSQANLSGADLKGADLKDADLKGADLGDGAKLNDANLSKVILSRAKLNKARLDRANLEGANLEGANLFKANLEGANLKEASLCGAKLNGVNLSQAVLFRANLKGISLRGAKLNKAKLNGAVLVDAILEGAILVEADLSGTDLSQAKLNGSNLEGANLFKANLEGASLRGANLSEVHLESALLTNTNLHGVYGLKEEQLENCKAEGAIIDISSTLSSSQLIVSSPPLSQSSDIQAQSVTSAQGDISTPDADGSSAVSSPQSPES
jgi:uncharacterized protein YjbI with pentapeptide repeats